jgi:hypothetical protein
MEVSKSLALTGKPFPSPEVSPTQAFKVCKTGKQINKQSIYFKEEVSSGMINDLLILNFV